MYVVFLCVLYGLQINKSVDQYLRGKCFDIIVWELIQGFFDKV